MKEEIIGYLFLSALLLSIISCYLAAMLTGITKANYEDKMIVKKSDYNHVKWVMISNVLIMVTLLVAITLISKL